MRRQQIIRQPPGDGRIAHATVGQQRLDEERSAAGQRGLDGQLRRGDRADERRSQGGAGPPISNPRVSSPNLGAGWAVVLCAAPDWSGTRDKLIVAFRSI